MPPSDADTRAQHLLIGDRAALSLSQPFLGSLLVSLELKLVEEFPAPFGTDGETCWMRRSFVLEAPAPVRRWALAHTVWHAALGHLLRRGRRELAGWDAAIDHDANDLASDVLRLPEHAFWLEEHRHAGAFAVYEALLREGGWPERAPGSEMLGADLHLEPQGQLANQMASDWRARLIAAVQQSTARGRPVSPAVHQLVADWATPRIPWREVLRQIITSTFGDHRTFVPPSRRHAWSGLFLPSRRGCSLELAVLLDTSASTQRFQKQILGELSGILGAVDRWRVTVWQVDSVTRRVDTWSESAPPAIDGFEWIGLGASDFVEAFRQLENGPPALLVVLSDGAAEVPRMPPTFPVLWALVGGGPAPAPWGTVVRIPEDEI